MAKMYINDYLTARDNARNAKRDYEIARERVEELRKVGGVELESAIIIRNVLWQKSYDASVVACDEAEKADVHIE